MSISFSAEVIVRAEAHVTDKTARAEVAVPSLPKVEASAGTLVHGGKQYGGTYEVVPSRSSIVLDTKDFMLKENIVIAPIPKNYGLVGFDGSTLTVE